MADKLLTAIREMAKREPHRRDHWANARNAVCGFIADCPCIEAEDALDALVGGMFISEVDAQNIDYVFSRIGIDV
jgi:hypothetical protein